MLKTIEDRILVQPIEEPKQTAAGFITEVRTEKPIKGLVLFVGPGRTLENGEREKMDDIKIGEEIMFTKYAPDSIEYKGEEIYSIKKSSILAINGKD